MFVKRLFAVILLLCMISMLIFTASATYENNNNSLNRESNYSEYALNHFQDNDSILKGLKISTDNIRINGQKTHTDFLFSVNDTMELNVMPNNPGTWFIAIDYKPEEKKIFDCIFSLTYEENKYKAYLPIVRKDSKEQYSIDRDGDEVVANQEIIDKYIINTLNNYSDLNKCNFEFQLKNGINKIYLKNETQNIRIKNIYVYKKDEVPEYSEYIKSYDKIKIDRPIVIEGERYALTTTGSIRGEAINNPSLFPYETKIKRINTLSSAWKTAGDKGVWAFDVKKSGLYSLSFHYKQNTSTNMTVYRNMEIDGKVLFNEMNNIAFPQTKSNKYNNYTFKINNNPTYIYLEKGMHTVSFTATLGPLAEVYNELLKLMQDINSFGININKLASSSVDQNRTWDTETYFPNAVKDLRGFSKRAYDEYKKLKQICGKEPVFANDLLYSGDLLNKVANVSRTIPNKAEDISLGDGSASKYIGTVLTKLTNQSMSFDRIYFGGENTLPKESVGFSKSLWEGLKHFIFSFSQTYEKKDKSQLKVWMAGSIPYVQVLQQLVDEKYNSVNNTDVKISIMAGGEKKLVLSNSAGTNPDVVLGVGYGTPFNLAIRGAAKNLLDYDDFLEFYNKEYNIESLIPMCYQNGIYGATDTQNFQILFYRKDILKTLGVDVPNTWSDVKALMPLLLRYNMNVYLPLSATGMKPLSSTGPFLFQNNSDFYSDKGMSVGFDSINGLKAFTEMTDLYNIYSVQNSIPNFFNSFRYGEIPIGLSGFSTYLQLELAAPELSGIWGTALSPGVEQDGKISRFQVADSTASMILNNTNKSKEAWDFLKWWLSSETQLNYANLLTNTLGPEYRWNTANLEAFNQLSYPDEMKNIVLEQWKYQKEISSHAAAYMIQRETNNAWLNVVVNGKGLVESVDSAAILSNREIKRKMQEFGFCDENGKSLKEYKVWSYQDLVNLLKEREHK